MNKKIYPFCLVVIFLLLGTYNLWAQTVPSPLKNVKIQARVVLDENGLYHYYHTVTNPTENKIGIGDVNIDITVSNYGIPPEYVEVEGYTQPDSFSYANAQRKGLVYVPVAWKDTSLWGGGISHEDKRSSFLGNAVVIDWCTEYNFTTKYQYLLNPGQTSEELEIVSYGLPGIRKVVFRPDWTEIDWPPEYRRLEEDSVERMFEKDRKKESLSYLSTTIGPAAPPAFTKLQFNQLMQEYVSQCVTLGWLKDAMLTQQLNSYLAQSATAIKENHLTEAQNIITHFMNAVQNSNLDQRTTEAHGLLYYNAKFFFQQITAEIPPTVEIYPNKAEHNLNETHTTQVKVMRGYVPQSGFTLTARVMTGPHEGMVWGGLTDANGNWSFNYQGISIGTDIIKFIRPQAVEIISSDILLWQPYTMPESAPILVTWKGGADLMLNEFFPPMIGIPFQRNAIPFEESTINIGNIPAPASVTRCWLSKDNEISPDDIFLTQRAVPPLEINEISKHQASVAVPENLEQGLYYIHCCADANKEIIELNEMNNCETFIVQLFAPVVAEDNSPPDCTQASATPDSLWPPNHKYRKITVGGITDPDGDRVTLTINSIKQDEPVNGLGDGNTSPDATINPLRVRAERSGTGNGRVYHVGFTAQDDKGGKCEGVVKICVPHDQAQQKTCDDDGPLYDSLKP